MVNFYLNEKINVSKIRRQEKTLNQNNDVYFELTNSFLRPRKTNGVGRRFKISKRPL